MGLHIEDVTIRKVVTIDSDASVKEATNKMNNHSTSSLVVLSENKVDGILTTRDIVSRVVAKGLDPNDIQVGEIASRPVVMMRPEAPLEEAIKIMLQRKIKKIPLVSEREDRVMLVGLLSLSDVIEYHSGLFSILWEQIILTAPADEIEDLVCVA
ncbi:MAG: CBS domain-containing protein [Candidatus Bathyarchaeota archaeon]|nr:MAG: CBS domain-containing protein [Candidatus Bathyarchaeota archaeon]